MAPLIIQNTHQKDWNRLLTCPFGCPGVGWAWAWAGEKKPRKRKKKEKISLTREFRQPLGPSSWVWGGSQALLSFHWLGIASGNGYLSDHRANHVSVPDRPSCEDSWVGSAQGQARVFACA